MDGFHIAGEIIPNAAGSVYFNAVTKGSNPDTTVTLGYKYCGANIHFQTIKNKMYIVGGGLNIGPPGRSLFGIPFSVSSYD